MEAKLKKTGYLTRIILSLSAFFWLSAASAQLRRVELSHYLFEDFTEGIVLMKDGMGRKVNLNYNALSQEMVFIDRGRKLAIADEELLNIDTIYIEGRVFFLLNNKFVELLYKSDTELFAEHRCNVQSPARPTAYGGTSRSTTSTSYGQLTYETHIYELKLPDGFEVEPYIIYWLKKDGELQRITSLRQLNRLYAGKRNLVREYQRANRVDFKEPETVALFVAFMESN